jgi:hypothetical protein
LNGRIAFVFCGALVAGIGGALVASSRRIRITAPVLASV